MDHSKPDRMVNQVTIKVESIVELESTPRAQTAAKTAEYHDFVVLLTH